MARNNRVPNVNASLIREGRMIFQQLSQIFGNSDKVDNVFAMKAAQARAEADIAKAKAPKSTLKCAFCLHVRKDNALHAVTIMNGQAVCDDHAYYAQGGEFNRILAIIRGDEKR